MSKLTLYHIAPSRSSTVLWLLEEIGEPYEIRLLSMKRGENREPDYLKINPMGKVPAIDHDGVIVTESAAVCCYLADAFPAAGLNIPVGERERGPYLKWLFFSPGVIEPAVMDQAFRREEAPPRSALGYGDFDTVMDVLADAVSKGPYLVGGRFTAADLVIGSMLHWGMAFGLIPEREEFKAYSGPLVERPAARRAQARDEELKSV